MPSYPTFSTGVRVYRPWEYHRAYKNLHVDMPHGYRYSYNLRATPLMLFVINYPNLSDADLATLESFVAARKGAYEEFDFTDPETTTVHARCRFDQQALDVRSEGYNENAVTVRIQEYHG